MTDKQFNELKNMLEAIHKDLKTVDKNVISTFNVANTTNAYVGADEGASSNSDMLPKILKAVTKK
ncbi:MAG: hypothetical protein JXR05_12120 [Flavobacteriaceae bacterium]